MILIEESKTGQLVLCKNGKEITSMPLKKFLNSLGCVEEDAVWWSFKIKDLVDEVSGATRIWTKDKYTEFTKRLNKLEVKRKVFLRLANVEKDKKEEDSWAKRLDSNTKVSLSFIFGFFYNFLWVYIKYLGKQDDWMRYNNDGIIEWDMIMMGC